MEREVKVFVKEKNYEIDVHEICPSNCDELVSGRIFETIKEMQFLLMTLKRFGNRFALEQAHTCPANYKIAIETIENLPRYK